MENLELEFCTYNNVNKINKTIFWGGGGGAVFVPMRCHQFELWTTLPGYAM